MHTCIYFQREGEGVVLSLLVPVCFYLVFDLIFKYQEGMNGNLKHSVV